MILNLVCHYVQLIPINLEEEDGVIDEDDEPVQYQAFETKEELINGIADWDRNRRGSAAAESLIATYGPVKNWDVTQITDMSSLFARRNTKNFNEDISGWGCKQCGGYGPYVF